MHLTTKFDLEEHDLFGTFGGIDINSQGFNDYFIESGKYKVWDKKEQWLGIAGILAYQSLNGLSYDIVIHKKLDGKNTDDSTTFTIGIGKFWGVLIYEEIINTHLNHFFNC